jgi:hypothetical protein
MQNPTKNHDQRKAVSAAPGTGKPRLTGAKPTLPDVRPTVDALTKPSGPADLAIHRQVAASTSRRR